MAPSAASPKANTVGGTAAKARQAEASRAAMAADARPATVKTPSGKPVAVSPSVASRVRPESSSTRTVRVTRVYNVHHYGGWSYHPYQHDAFHPMLTGYLLGRLSSPTYYGPTRDWVYANYDAMDPVRREELFRENARLRVDVERMRAENVAVAAPSLDGVDPDLLYNDQAAGSLYAASRPAGPSFWKILGWTLVVVLVVVLVLCLLAVDPESGVITVVDIVESVDWSADSD